MSRLSLLLLVGACRLGPADLESQVSSHMDHTGLTYGDCGQASASCAQDDPAISCFQAAWDACSPTRLDLVAPTVEGDPITTVLLVEPVGSNCSIFQFVDSTQDAFGSGEIESATCYDLVANEDGVCPAVYAEECYSDCGGSADCG